MAAELGSRLRGALLLTDLPCCAVAALQELGVTMAQATRADPGHCCRKIL